MHSSTTGKVARTPGASRRARVWIAGGLLVGAVALAGFGWMLRQLPYPVKPLHGGTAALVAVTCGKGQPLTLGTGWQQLLALAPQAAKTPPSGALLPADPRLTAWVVYDWGGIRRADPSRADVTLHGPDGEVWIADPAPSFSTRYGWVRGYAFPLFPRRTPTLTLRIEPRLGGGQPRKVEFAVSNPVEREYPTWKPVPLPAAKTTGDLRVELKALVNSVNQNGQVTRRRPGIDRTAAVFSFTRQGRPQPEWQPVVVDCSDATGNRVRVHWPSVFRERDESRCLLTPCLPTSERAWKLRAELSRYLAEGARPNEVWTLPRVPVPTRFPPEPGARSSRFAVAPGVTLLVEPIGRNGENLSVTYRLLAPGKKPFRATIDGTGAHRAIVANAAPYPLFREAHPAWNLALTTRQRHLNLTFGIFYSRYVEFVVPPASRGM